MNTNWNQRYIDADTPWDCGSPAEELRRFLDRKLVEPCRVLELGCGTGTNAIFLAQAGFQVTAVDLSEEALRQARAKAEQAGIEVTFLQSDITDLPELGEPFPFVFDRGTYHIVRRFNLVGLQNMLARMTAHGGLYLVLAGNANDEGPADKGPPRVTSAEMCAELEFDNFDLVSLEEARFHGVKIDGRDFSPLSWSGIFRRRHSKRLPS